MTEKSNETPYFAPLSDDFKDLKGVFITADALHTQRTHPEYLQDRGAHYVLTVEKNQPGLHAQYASLLWDRVRVGNTSWEMANGRDIVRTPCHGLPAQHSYHDSPAPGRNQPRQSHPGRPKLPRTGTETSRSPYQLNDFAGGLYRVENTGPS